MLDYDGDLNPQQLAVVKAAGGPILVIAGAGSGKTRVVTYRVAYLIESGVDPSRILLLTFTNKAAREMLHRVEVLVPTAGGAGGRVWGGTFHHIGNRILRRHAPLVGYQPNYSILDRDDAKKLMNSCLSDLKINPRKSRFPKGEVIGSLWGLAVNTRKPIAEIVLERVPYFHGFLDDIQAVVERYRNRKRELNVMDFDDLLFYWETLLREHPEVRKRYNEQFQHLLVDEYQDTNRLQADVLDLLARQHGNIMVVGDDSQSIYSFRGANFANILTFPERYPGSKIYKLEVNYRSTPEILHLANTSIVHNRYQFPKELQTIRPPGSRPILVPVQDIMEQASFVAQKLEEINQQGVPLAQMAVLYRAHYHSMELQMELSRRRIPYEVRSGLRFFEQAHIKDVSSYLKITSNPLDELAWKRVLLLYPKIGKSTADKIWQMVLSGFLNPQTSMDAPEVLQKIPGRVRENWRLFSRTLSMLRDLEKTSGPGGMIDRVLQEGYESYLQSKYPDYESRMDDLRQLAAFAYRYSSCQDFLSELALLTSLEGESTPVRGRDENGTVKLSSVHQAKGLEWSVVFIIWLAEGRFPSVRSLLESGGEGEEEERRLFYVAITRARDELFLCYPRFAPDRGRREMIQRPSRFIAELSGVGYERFNPDEEGDDRW
ncbi:MAG: ATP-dependent helicase [Deltaproteobacteria bacterium]|nr:ATP-dependent helicase [Deltaproteobacteria bacterium]